MHLLPNGPQTCEIDGDLSGSRDLRDRSTPPLRLAVFVLACARS
jgi:hypothetical protein